MRHSIVTVLSRYDYSYKGYMEGVVPDMDHLIHLGSEWEGVYNTPFWFTFITEAERRLSAAGISSRGTADGDLRLPACCYASLRNEAYVSVPVAIHESGSSVDSATATSESVGLAAPTTDAHTAFSPLTASQEVAAAVTPPPASESAPRTRMELVYPPNSMGWNAAAHRNPYLDLIFFLRAIEKDREAV
jgi:hypothetical protein